VVEPKDFVFEGPLEMGRTSPVCGAAAWAYIRRAVGLVQAGEADAIVTAPIHKEALRAAGCPYPGHTEMLAALAGGARVAMLLVGGGIRVALATIHEPIARVPSLLTEDKILDLLRLMKEFIPWFGVERPGGPRIAVTGLNPHAGEGGMFGDEEKRIVAPAIERARSEGIDALGPVPADTIFFFHRQGSCDAVLAMFHDQALIPVKTLDFHAGVNVTMGLPFIRTSVDHGTAFNIAGQGTANAGSLRAALECAALLSRNRRLRETAI
jgi:4-hydroxythreonine-4-phosphate dehydrogenase